MLNWQEEMQQMNALYRLISYSFLFVGVLSAHYLVSVVVAQNLILHFSMKQRYNDNLLVE